MPHALVYPATPPALLILVRALLRSFQIYSSFALDTAAGLQRRRCRILCRFAIAPAKDIAFVRFFPINSWVNYVGVAHDERPVGAPIFR
jgi:hypothetical protein